MKFSNGYPKSGKVCGDTGNLWRKKAQICPHSDVDTSAPLHGLPSTLLKQQVIFFFMLKGRETFFISPFLQSYTLPIFLHSG
jgi:hypothetical protein